MIITLVTSRQSRQLRGYLTRFIYELDAGIYVGDVSSRIRDHLWNVILQESGESGKAWMAYPSSDSTQRMVLRSHNTAWSPTNVDGVVLISRRLKIP